MNNELQYKISLLKEHNIPYCLDSITNRLMIVESSTMIKDDGTMFGTTETVDATDWSSKQLLEWLGY